VFVVKPSVVLELTFVKRCLLFFVYGSCRKERTNVTRRSKKRITNRRKEPRAHSAEKVPISPVLSLVIHSHSAEFLQQIVSLILLCFAYLFYCPWSVSCWKIQPTGATPSLSRFPLSSSLLPLNLSLCFAMKAGSFLYNEGNGPLLHAWPARPACLLLWFSLSHA
jgi:hypothetical protein